MTKKLYQQQTITIEYVNVYLTLKVGLVPVETTTMTNLTD